MALASRPIHIPAGAGINEGTRPEWIEFGQGSLANENVRQVQRMGLGKRYGFGTPLTQSRIDATSAASGYKLFADGQQICRVAAAASDLARCEAYDAISARWVPQRGYLPECTASTIELPNLGVDLGYLADVAITTNGYIGAVWLSATATSSSVAAAYMFGAVINPTTGVIVSPPTQIGSTSNASNNQMSIVAVGAYLIAVRYSSASTNIEAHYLDTTSPATITTGWVAMTNLATDARPTSAKVRTCSLPHASQARAALLYQTADAGTDRIKLVTFDQTGVLESAAINTSSTTVGALDVGGNATDTLWCVWTETTNIRARGFSPAAITVVLATTATVGTFTGTASALYVVPSATAGNARAWLNHTASSLPHLRHLGITTSGGAAAGTGTPTTVQNTSLVGRPFVYGGRFYGPVNTEESYDAFQTITVAIADMNTDAATTFRPVAVPYPNLSSVFYSGWATALVSGTKVYVPFTPRRSAANSGSCLVALDFGSSARWRNARVRTSQYFGGACTFYSDGARVAEAGFIFRPNKPTTSVAGTGITGTFRYVAVYEEVDAEGNWHQSAVSRPSDTRSPANQTVTVAVNPLVISSRLGSSSQASPVRVAFYRTATGGTAPYYRLGTVDNVTTAATVSFADSVEDATLTTRAKLYTQPGVIGTAQAKQQPPAFVDVTEHLGCLVGLSESEVWVSGQPVYGEGTWFSPIFSQPLSGGTAIASQDGFVFAFTRRQVYALPCEPPTDNGAAGGLGAPQLIASDVGCIDPRSVVVTAVGIFFQSERGIELLDRGRAVQWVGESVATTLAAYPIVSSARLDPLESVVYFELAASEADGQVSGNGRTLVFDLAIKDWVSTDRRKNSAGTADTPAQDSAVVWSGSAYRYAWLATDARVYIEDRTTYLDTGAWVTAKWETVDCKFGLQQQQRVYNAMILFTRNSAAGLKIETAYDGADYSASNDKTWTEAETLTGLRQLDFRPRAQGQRMRFRVTDTAPATLGTGQGFTWVGLSVDIAPKQGATKATPHLATSTRK